MGIYQRRMKGEAGGGGGVGEIEILAEYKGNEQEMGMSGGNDAQMMV